MKAYECTFRHVLPRRAYTLLRLNGRAFRTYLRGAVKPFDMNFVAEMGLVAKTLCEEIQGARFAYHQSDEISILLTDFESTQSQPWVNGRADKIISLSASLASVTLGRLRYLQLGVPTFDCRVWSMSDPVEVANYFVWRQRDCVRNSIQSAGQHYFSPKQLFGLNGSQIQEMLHSHHEVNWNDYPSAVKRGQVVVHAWGEGWATVVAPHFEARPQTFLAREIPPLPSLAHTLEDE